MSEPTFTKEQLEKIERLARAFGHEPAVMGDELANVAVFALRLMADNNSLRRHKIQLGEERAAEWKRAEKAEAERDAALEKAAQQTRMAANAIYDLGNCQKERDEARRELVEAEEAINEVDFLIGPLPTARKAAWRAHPAVRRALERKP